eukprot:gene3567-4071_t
MDVVKRFLGLTNCHGEKLLLDSSGNNNNNNRTNLQAFLTGRYHLQYLGYIFCDQPDSSEIQRACNCLVNRQRKPFVFTFSDDSMIGISEEDVSNVVQLVMHRVVFSCVDAKHQKIVVVFYHNPENPDRTLGSSGLECHLMLAKSREHARKFAERMADELIFTYQRRKKCNMIKEENLPSHTLANYVTYENIRPPNSSESPTISKTKINKVDVNEGFNGSTSTFSKSSCTTVASAEIEEDNHYSSLWESLQDLDLPGESLDDPSSTPKPHFHDDVIAQVHKTSGLPSDGLFDLMKFNFRPDEFSSLDEMDETNI